MALATLGLGTSGKQELLSLRSNSPRFARDVFCRFVPGHCSRSAPTALATLGDPPGLLGIYLGLLGHLHTISVKPRSKFQKSEKIAFRPKNAFRPKSPLCAEKTRNAARILKFSGVPSALAGSDRTCGDVRPTLRGAISKNFENFDIFIFWVCHDAK